MNFTKKITTIAVSTSLVFGTIAVAPISQSTVQAVSITQQQAIKKYNDFQDSYNRHEVPIIRAFEQQYDGSLAHQVVARAIWYMEHGYTVYSVGGRYDQTGLLDCSNYTRLVYGDFGINITSVSRNYNQVGTKVAGVSSTRVGTSSSGQPLYGIRGIENLRPGDILTYWAGSGDNKYISHVAIYMGVIDGKPAVINTVKNRPTALGIVNNFSYWFGENFLEARRILPSDAWNPAAGSKYTPTAPVIPSSYYLPPQRPIVMPTNQVANTTTQPATTSSNNTTVQHVIVTGNTINVRSGPSTNHSILAVVKNGDILNAIGKSGNWYAIRLANGTTGYVADWLVENYTAPTNNSSTNTNTNTNTTNTQTNSILVSQVTSHSVNVRSAASTSSTILGVVLRGDEVVVKRQLNGWYEIDWLGSSAYIASSLLSTPTTRTVTNTVNTATVTGNIVNVRSGAGLNFDAIAIVRRGDIVEVISSNNSWTHVRTGNQTGYIATWLLSI